MDTPDRARIIELLGRLGAENNDAVLEAARELHRRINESGVTWDALIRTDPDASDSDAEREEEPVETVLPADRTEALRLIDRLLARKDLSDTLRQDLTEMKRTTAKDGLDAMDAKYIRALAKRLGV